MRSEIVVSVKNGYGKPHIKRFLLSSRTNSMGTKTNYHRAITFARMNHWIKKALE